MPVDHLMGNAEDGFGEWLFDDPARLFLQESDGKIGIGLADVAVELLSPDRGPDFTRSEHRHENRAILAAGDMFHDALGSWFGNEELQEAA